MYQYASALVTNGVSEVKGKCGNAKVRSSAFCLEIFLIKGANYKHLTASSCVGLWLSLNANDNFTVTV